MVSGSREMKGIKRTNFVFIQKNDIKVIRITSIYTATSIAVLGMEYYPSK